MAELKNSNNKQRRAANSTAVPISDIFFLTLRHWPWVILSVVICVGAAYAYLLRTPNVYTRSADILFKDESLGYSATTETFDDMGLIRMRSNLSNEIITLHAKDLMEEVVRRLGLDVNYYREGRFHDMAVYGVTQPIKVSFPDLPEQSSLRLEVKVDPTGNVALSGLGDKEYKGKLGTPIKTSEGKVLVETTPAYEKGEKIQLSVEKIPVASACGRYVGRLGITQTDEKGTVLRLTMSDVVPQRADDVLQALIGVYNEQWIRDRNQITVASTNFINERLGVIESELGHVDSDISSYKSANLIPDVDAAASMYMSQSQQTSAQILDVNNQLAMARYIRSYLTSEANRDQLLPANTGVQNSNILGLINEYNDKILQRNSLIAKSSEKNPLVAQLDEQLAAQRQAIIRTVDNEIVNLNTQLKTLRGSEAQTISRLASNPNQARNLLSVERQQKVKEALYLFLLQKREENELSQCFTAYNTRIINKPGPGPAPVTPNRTQLLSLAFLIGLFIPFGFTYVKESLNTRLRGRKDIEHLTLPFVGEIPFTDKKKDNDKSVDKHKLVVREGERNVVNEAFRVLRTNVEFMSQSHPGECTVIAITSFNPHSGKSFITMNLGETLALKHRRVLVIDGDMRHGSASRYGNKPEKGLAEYLGGSVSDVDSVIVQIPDAHGLSLLPIGNMPPNPAELLENPRFEQMLKHLRTEYDYILIDCPPIEVVADAQIIDKYVDRTIFVMRVGLMERAMLPVLERMYEDKKYKNMAIILNGTANYGGKYGYHSYRYGYGYGYGYGYNYGTEGTGKGHKKNSRES